ncbi:NmrA family protein [Corallococcus coralloides DSM 2259]|uniref:NmrA family protein n=1 Tax=Corallococcus coralloides (strain ATCC 25202 / DSM 2259 / NBRC 100086 / M2) TaxID=1144275 RepID=H8MXR1_CORCM|nr:NAD(P)H-binding protein [Corallococcus coralloides]AFE10890.1 NmrA family protein [Corallococcus coralloides DSM 2259]
MTRVLVIGAAGNTGRPIAQGLTAEGVTVRTATRDTRPPVTAAEHVRFDWADPSTHEAAFEGVDRMYALAPALVEDPSVLMISVLKRALAGGVRRVVLLSASAVPEEGPGLGQVHHFLRTHAPEWAVLQPSWFMQNFISPGHHHAVSIQRDGALVTATGQGRVGFVDAGDIAAVGVRALADAASHDTAHVITGPQALSYDDLAAILSRVSGRPIRHVHATPEEAQRHLQASGMPEIYARFLTLLDTSIRDGAENRVTDTVLRVTGRPPRDFESFVRAHPNVWH